VLKFYGADQGAFIVWQQYKKPSKLVSKTFLFFGRLGKNQVNLISGYRIFYWTKLYWALFDLQERKKTSWGGNLRAYNNLNWSKKQGN